MRDAVDVVDDPFFVSCNEVCEPVTIAPEDPGDERPVVELLTFCHVITVL
jgi:hypothetical protein